MTHLMRTGLATLSAMVLIAFAAGSASATTLEVGGVTQNKAVTIEASLEPGTSLLIRDTNNLTQDTCTASTIQGTTQSPFTGSKIGGPLSTFTLSNCTHTSHVLASGSLSVSQIGATTDGTIYITATKFTVISTVFGISITCSSGDQVDVGRFTSRFFGLLTKFDLDFIINCGFFVPTAKVEGSYVVTSPSGLGVSA
jgi:hypothetical protein